MCIRDSFYITGKTYKKMTAHEKKSLEVAANASLAKSLSYRIYENGKALRELTTKHGVIFRRYSIRLFHRIYGSSEENIEQKRSGK